MDEFGCSAELIVMILEPSIPSHKNIEGAGCFSSLLMAVIPNKLIPELCRIWGSAGEHR